MNQKFYSLGRIGDVVNGAKVFGSTIVNSPGAFGVSHQQAANFQRLIEDLQTKFQLALDQGTRTPVAITARSGAQRAMKQEAILLAKIIEATPTVSDAQLVTIGLLPRRSPVSNPAPTTRPGVRVESVVSRTVTIRFHDLATPTRRGKPQGTIAAWVYSFVGAIYQDTPSQWNFCGRPPETNFN